MNTEGTILIKDVKCRNFDICQTYTTKSYAKDFYGRCPACAIRNITSPISLDERDEIKSKRRSHTVLY